MLSRPSAEAARRHREESPVPSQNRSRRRMKSLPAAPPRFGRGASISQEAEDPRMPDGKLKYGSGACRQPAAMSLTGLLPGANRLLLRGAVRRPFLEQRFDLVTQVLFLVTAEEIVIARILGPDGALPVDKYELRHQEP